MFNVQLAEVIPLLRRPKTELQGLMADKLSGGQKHQLSLAMTLATNPRLVILDEPSAGLSPKAVEEMYQMLRDVKAKLNVTIILIEQNIAKAVEFSDISLLLSQGSIIAEFTNDNASDVESVMFDSIIH
jgi:ABC-type branched-subunit amino acid transport system ATPase component